MKRQTHNERVLELLSDGRPHTHHEIYALHVVGHSRISDLRKKGHQIEHWREGRVDVYLLVRGRGDGQASAPSNEQLAPPSLIPAGCSFSSASAEAVTSPDGVGAQRSARVSGAEGHRLEDSAPERRWEPADPPGVGASGVAHASDGAGAENQLTVFDALEAA